MFYRRCNRFHHCHCCNNANYEKEMLETKCENVVNYEDETDDCACGFDTDNNPFPEYPMYAQSYVPVQTLDTVFKPKVGLKHGTIFPELVSPYRPGQSMEEIEYIRETNKIKEGCNR